jgi:hypothetical protein
MTLGRTADEAFAFLCAKFGEDYVTKNPSAALRFAGDWLIASTNDNISSAIMGLQDVLFVPDAPHQAP